MVVTQKQRKKTLKKVGKVNGVISALVSLKDNQFIRFIKLNMIVMFDVSKLLTKFLEGIWKILEKLQEELCNGVPVQQITGMKTQLSKLFKRRNIHEMSSVEFFFTETPQYQVLYKIAALNVATHQ